MNQSLQCQLVHRALTHVDHRTTDTDGEPVRLAAAAYADPQLDMFRRVPLAVGHVSQIPEPGDFFTHDHAGVPLIIARTDDGIVAMVNVCRHRGTRVESAPCGKRDKLVCPYHAWTYARDGRLLGIPHRKAFGVIARSGSAGPRSDAERCGESIDGRDLVRVPVADVDGLIFVQLEGAFDPTWLGPIADELAGFGLDTGHFYAPVEWPRAMSWKLGIDIFLETYHLRPTHGSSIFPMFYDNIGLVDRIGPHVREIIPKRSIETLRARPEADWRIREHANVLYHLFPNTLVLVQADHTAIVHIWPAGPSSALLHAYMLVPEPPRTDKARGYWDANRTILHDAVREDLAMGESIQRGMSSGATRDVVFGAFEHALSHFHEQLARYRGSKP